MVDRFWILPATVILWAFTYWFHKKIEMILVFYQPNWRTDFDFYPPKPNYTLICRQNWLPGCILLSNAQEKFLSSIYLKHCSQKIRAPPPIPVQLYPVARGRAGNTAPCLHQGVVVRRCAGCVDAFFWLNLYEDFQIRHHPKYVCPEEQTNREKSILFSLRQLAKWISI